MLLFLLGVTCVGWVAYQHWATTKKSVQLGDLSCVTNQTVTLLDDPHMEGYLDPRDRVRILKGYYKCNKIERDHLVQFEAAKGVAPVLRIVRGVPGDQYELVEDPEKKGHWLISINNEPVMGSDGRYYIKSNRVPALRTYQIARGGRLRDNEYILFSYTPPGLSDSSNLGLIKPTSILGRAHKTD